MPPHACLLRSLGRHAFRVAPAPVDHAHRPLHCKVSITRHVSFLWSGRVHGPHPFIIAERPSQLKPNAAMFHDASRKCPPRDSPTWSRTVTGVGGVSDATENIRTSGVRCLPSEGSHLHQSGSSSHPKRSRQNEPHAFRGGRRGAMARALQRGRCAGLRVPQYVPQRVSWNFFGNAAVVRDGFSRRHRDGREQACRRQRPQGCRAQAPSARDQDHGRETLEQAQQGIRSVHGSEGEGEVQGRSAREVISGQPGQGGAMTASRAR